MLSERKSTSVCSALIDAKNDAVNSWTVFALYIKNAVDEMNICTNENAMKKKCWLHFLGVGFDWYRSKPIVWHDFFAVSKNVILVTMANSQRIQIEEQTSWSEELTFKINWRHMIFSAKCV